jgi:hypothetical protein
LDGAFNFAVFDESSRELQTLRRTEACVRIVAALICRGLASFFLRRFVERFEKLFAEFTVALGDQTKYFTAQVRTAANHDWSAFGFHSLHVFSAFLCGFGVDSLSRFPGTAEKFASAFGIGVPQNVGGSRLHARASRLVFKGAGLVREARHEGNRDGWLLCGFDVSLFGCGLSFFGLCDSVLSEESKAETRDCEG